MTLLLEELKVWASSKALAAHESLFLLGSCADQNQAPSDLDILWVSDRPLQELWQKELYVIGGLPLDICIANASEIKCASENSHHPLAITALALKNQASYLAGTDIRNQLSLMDVAFIKEVRSLQAFKEWKNYLEFKKNKILQKVILGLSIATEKIPLGSGKSKKEMEYHFVKTIGELPEILTPESQQEVHQKIVTHCYPHHLFNRALKPNWQTWDLNHRLFELLNSEDQRDWRSGKLIQIKELKSAEEFFQHE